MIALYILAALAQAGPAQAPDATTSEVVVVAHRKPFRLSARALRAAHATFGEQRDRFAPNSSLRFVASMTRDEPATRPITLRLTDGTRSVPIVLDTDGGFTLPTLPDGKWWLEGNHGPRQLRIRPLVLSPGSDRYDRRLGDVRLQCRVLWAMGKADAPLIAAPLVGLVDAAGACDSRRIGFYERTPRPIQTATLVENARVVPLRTMKDRRSYQMPTAGRSFGDFGDEARVRIALD